MRMRLLVLFGLVVSLSGCAADDQLQGGGSATSGATPQATSSSEVPEEFRPACGKPGSRVVTERLEVRVKRSDCDLTGVTIVNQDRGVTVPERGGAGNSSGVDVDVDDATGDVTFKAEADVPQY